MTKKEAQTYCLYWLLWFCCMLHAAFCANEIGGALGVFCTCAVFFWRAPLVEDMA